MIRRIKSCQSCRKRFTTASGATLCLSCRKDETTTDSHSLVSSANFDCSQRATLEGNSESNLVGIANICDNIDNDTSLAPEEIQSFDKTPGGGESSREYNESATSETLTLGTCDENGGAVKGSISPGSPTKVASHHESMENLHDFYATSRNLDFQRKRIEETLDPQENCSGHKKIKLSVHDRDINDDNRVTCDFAQHDQAHEFAKRNDMEYSKIDERKPEIPSSREICPTEIIPLDESTCNSGGESGHGLPAHSDEIDRSIHKDDGCNISEDDESEILCWDASEPEPFCLGANNFDYDDGDCTKPDIKEQSNSCLLTNTDKVSHDSENGLQSAVPSPTRDVCYICGSDLSKLSTGIRGRVAHMKRCSAKYGMVSSSKDSDYGLDFDALGEEKRVELSISRPSNGNAGNAIFNPYAKDKWHGDAAIDLDANKPLGRLEPNALMKSKPQQTMLDRFLKAPVRSLTNVLMAGSRNLAKSKAIEDKKKSDASSGSKPQGKWGGGGWASKQNKGNCPCYKKIPGTDFICDGFLYASHSLSSNYFLTHFHSDHYGGITKQWNEGTIYCSVPTANLVHQQLGVEKRFLHPLPMNTPIVLASKDKPITVTLLDANHCPGAVMFVFEVGNKKILHVGDFRWNHAFMMAMPQLRAFSNMTPRLDEIFLDTTYCDPKYTLPTQDEAIAAAIKVVKDEISTANMMGTQTLLLFGSYTIGKEKIYLSVAEHLQTKVYVDKRRLRILSALEWPKERMNMFTTTKSESYLWVVPLGHVNFKKMPEYMEDGNKNKAFSKPYGRVVGFRPTGWTYSTPKKSAKPSSTSPQTQKLISSKTSGRYTVYGVPYSEHSSFPELVDCLRCLKPKKITTTVSVSKCEEQSHMLLSAVNCST
ncbi:hypothetical protein ACHAWX_005956 [Stephanocyclus meneghinianus]